VLPVSPIIPKQSNITLALHASVDQVTKESIVNSQSGHAAATTERKPRLESIPSLILTVMPSLLNVFFNQEVRVGLSFNPTQIEIVFQTITDQLMKIIQIKFHIAWNPSELNLFDKIHLSGVLFMVIGTKDAWIHRMLTSIPISVSVHLA
jgi:hypothetical protein